MKDYIVALTYGTLSAVTLPIGAVFGVYFSDSASDEQLALLVAFGAGALLFAVTVELYGDAIQRLDKQGYGIVGTLEISCSLLGAVVGAVMYIFICRWLDKLVLELATARPVRGKKRAMFAQLTQVDGYPFDNFVSFGNYSYGSTRTQSSQSPEDPSTALRHSGSLAQLSPRPKDGVRQPEPDPESKRICNGRVPISDACWTRLEDLRVALGIWLGVLLDGIPEAMMLGYLAAEHKLSFALVVALMISNFPEAFSSSALVRRHNVAGWKIVFMWLVLCIGTGAIACFTAWLLPAGMMEKGAYKPKYFWVGIFGAVVEGIAGGAMLACISNVMLPDAFRRQGDLSGVFVLCGFVVAVVIKVFCGAARSEIN
mmetsp:Transcript_119665/g.238345  ORF Transcript_119665/g.238345 Transcript_119665/m.238345 type:complete len:370 (-) Transcript_119665:54-1163(-)